MLDPSQLERHAPGEGLPAFQRLKARGLRLERSIFILVAFIAVAPPLLFAAVGLRDLHNRAAVHAQHVGKILEFYRAMPGARLERLGRHLRVELQHDSLADIEVSGADGKPLLRLGEPPRWSLPHAADLTLGPDAAPYARVRVRLDDAQLRRDVARLVAVHLLVGLALGLGIYRIPVRAFGRAVRELESAQAQLAHSNRLTALGAIYAGLAHEINNPLGILCARARLSLSAVREKGLDAETVDDLEVIERQGTRIAEIVRGLLTFARKAEVTMQPVDMNALVREVALVERPFAKQGVQVKSDLGAGLPPLRASPDQIEQVLLNLVTNARDAMAAGRTVTLRTAAREGEVVTEVRDTGPGLSAEVQRHLFEPFFTTKVFKLAPNDISPMIATSGGWEVVQLESVKDEERPPLDKARPRIEGILTRRKTEERKRAFSEALWSKYHARLGTVELSPAALGQAHRDTPEAAMAAWDQQKQRQRRAAWVEKLREASSIRINQAGVKAFAKQNAKAE